MIHEALDMIGNLSETLSTTSADGERRAQVAERFVRVVKDCQLFATPDYVSLICTNRDVDAPAVCNERQAQTVDTPM